MTALRTTETLGLAPEPGTRIIRREDYARWLEGQSVLEAAQALAGKWRQRAAREYGRQMALAREEGLAGIEAERAAMLSAFAEDSVRHVATVESALEQVVIDALQVMLGEVPREEQLAATLRRLLDEVATREQLRVSLNPVDRPDLARVMEAPESDLPPLTLRSDAEVAPGRIRLEHPMGVVESGLEDYLRALAGDDADDAGDG